MSIVAKPGGLLEQHKLLRAVINSPWVTRLDIKVTDNVIDRYFAKHGNARASLRYLEQATGAERNKIIPSLRRLTEKGVISIARQGIGTRPTEYALNFDFGANPPSGALEGTTTSGALEATGRGALGGTASAPSGAPEGTESYLRCRSTDRHTVSRTEDTPAAASPPPVAGEPAPAGSARDPKKETPPPFDELWDAYGRRIQRAAAKVAYEKLGPDSELHERMVSAAREWHQNYEANGTAAKYRKRLHTWIGGEGWLEDPPPAYEDAKEAGIAKAKERGPRKAKEGQPDASQPAVNRVSKGTPTGRHVVEIVNSDVVGSDLSFTYRILGGKHDGVEFTHQFLYGSYDTGCDDLEIEQGQLLFAVIRKATGMINVGDTTELHGSRLVAIVSNDGTMRYQPAKDSERGPAPEPETDVLNVVSPLTPIGRHTVEIIGSDLANVSGEKILCFRYRIKDGEYDGQEFDHKFALKALVFDQQQQGQQFFANIRRATGIISPTDSDDMHGSILCAIVSKGGGISYEPDKASERGQAKVEDR